MEAELSDSRRNIFLALLLCSLSLVLTALIARSARTLAKAESSGGFTEALQVDLLRLANGEFTQQSSVPRDTPSGAAVASAYEAAVKVFAEQQAFSRNMLDQSSALAMQQQEVIESLEGRIATLSEDGTTQSADLQAKVLELQSLAATFGSSGGEGSAGFMKLLADSVTDVSSSLARLTAQLDVCSGRIERAVVRVSTLQAALKGIEKNAEESSIQALNESIRHSGYPRAGNDAERFVESAQRVSRQLQMSADHAVEEALHVYADLQSCSDAVRESLVAAQEGAQHALHSTRIVKTAGDDSGPDLSQLHGQLQELIASLQQAEITNRVSLPEAELLFLKGHALELQLLAAEYTQSTAEPSLEEVQADER